MSKLKTIPTVLLLTACGILLSSRVKGQVLDTISDYRRWFCGLPTAPGNSQLHYSTSQLLRPEHLPVALFLGLTAFLDERF